MGEWLNKFFKGRPREEPIAEPIGIPEIPEEVPDSVMFTKMTTLWREKYREDCKPMFEDVIKGRVSIEIEPTDVHSANNERSKNQIVHLSLKDVIKWQMVTLSDKTQKQDAEYIIPHLPKISPKDWVEILTLAWTQIFWHSDNHIIDDFWRAPATSDEVRIRMVEASSSPLLQHWLFIPNFTASKEVRQALARALGKDLPHSRQMLYELTIGFTEHEYKRKEEILTRWPITSDPLQAYYLLKMNAQLEAGRGRSVYGHNMVPLLLEAALKSGKADAMLIALKDYDIGWRRKEVLETMTGEHAHMILAHLPISDSNIPRMGMLTVHEAKQVLEKMSDEHLKRWGLWSDRDVLSTFSAEQKERLRELIADELKERAILVAKK